MSSLDKARETQLRNIETKTGKSLDELRQLIAASGLSKHGEIRAMLQEKFGLGYGDANSLVHFALQSDGQSAAESSGASLEMLLAEIYSGRNEPLRMVHDAVMAGIDRLGEFEIAPKKNYLSLRRKRQFAMVGPGTRSRLEVGLNLKDAAPAERLEAQKPGGMCQYKVFLTDPAEVDDELMGWIRQAYDSAG